MKHNSKVNELEERGEKIRDKEVENVKNNFSTEEKQSNIPRDNKWDSSRINERHKSSVKE